VTTAEGLQPELRNRWVDAFVAAGASQCGFCTPGILLRLAALEQGGRGRALTRQAVESALLAHLCRCTGWQSIIEAACAALGIDDGGSSTPATDPLLAQWRGQVEGHVDQSSGPGVVLGGGGFADDRAPAGSLVHLGAAEMAPTPSLAASRGGTAKVQGRNSTVALVHPVALPEGEWALTLQTTWVEPAYVEPDSSWCLPDAPPATPLANGGAFGGKRRSPVPARANHLANALGHPVRVLWSREDVVRHGPKRPPLSLGLRPDGSGVVRIGRTTGSPELDDLRTRVHAIAPEVVIEEVDIVGPLVGSELRGAGWVEVLAALHVLRAHGTGPADANGGGKGRADVTLPGGGHAAVAIDMRAGEQGRGTVTAEIWAGEILHPVTLRSYVIGAVHQALGLVWSEGIAVDTDGAPLDLTIRSFGILTAREMPQVEVILHDEDRWPVNGSDAAFAATAAAAWIAEGAPPTWPTRRGGMTQRGRAPIRSRDREEKA
jgi:hypothetical protein